MVAAPGFDGEVLGRFGPPVDGPRIPGIGLTGLLNPSGDAATTVVIEAANSFRGSDARARTGASGARPQARRRLCRRLLDPARAEFGRAAMWPRWPAGARVIRCHTVRATASHHMRSRTPRPGGGRAVDDVRARLGDLAQKWLLTATLGLSS